MSSSPQRTTSPEIGQTGISPGARNILSLQRTIENRAVLQLMKQGKRGESGVMGLRGGRVSSGVETSIRSTRGRGNSLDPVVQRQRERSLGYEFGSVDEAGPIPAKQGEAKLPVDKTTREKYADRKTTLTALDKNTYVIQDAHNGKLTVNVEEKKSW